MKTQIRTVTANGVTYTALMFWCPGCETETGDGGLHMLPVVTGDEPGPPGRPSWSFNGNFERPTLTPSILTRGEHRGLVCHSFLVDGVFGFLTDSTHKFAGQSVPIPDLPQWTYRESGGTREDEPSEHDDSS
jgi:Family of unknown function (DUF6527)